MVYLKKYWKNNIILFLSLVLFVEKTKEIDLEPGLLKAILKHLNLDENDMNKLIPMIDNIKNKNNHEVFLFNKRLSQTMTEEDSRFQKPINWITKI